MAQEQASAFTHAAAPRPPPLLPLLSFSYRSFSQYWATVAASDVHSTFVPLSTSRRPAAVTLAASWPSHRQSRSLLPKSGPSQHHRRTRLSHCSVPTADDSTEMQMRSNGWSASRCRDKPVLLSAAAGVSSCVVDGTGRDDGPLAGVLDSAPAGIGQLARSHSASISSLTTLARTRSNTSARVAYCRWLVDARTVSSPLVPEAPTRVLARLASSDHT